MLIKIIEEEELYKYDHPLKRTLSRPESVTASAENPTPSPYAKPVSVNYLKREEMRNGIICIEIQAGDSFENIATYYGIKLRKLLQYNDKKDTSLTIGQYVFLKKKKNKAARGYEFHRVKPGDTLYLIAQMYGVKLKSLVKFNYIDSNTPLIEGEKIYLRSKAGV